MEYLRDLRCGIHRQPRQRTNGLGLEQLFGSERQTLRARPAHGLQRDDRIAAQLEKVFGDANRLQPQQLLPDVRQQ